MLITFVLASIVFCVLAFRGLGFLAWIAAAGVWLVGWRVVGVDSPVLFQATVIVLAALAILFGVPLVRRHLVSRFIMPAFAKVLPRLGETERIALEAGTVWWDGELFGGMPNWQKLIDFNAPPLRDDERAFLEGPAEELCRKLDDWDVYQRRDLSPEIWDFIKRQRCFDG